MYVTKCLSSCTFILNNLVVNINISSCSLTFCYLSMFDLLYKIWNKTRVLFGKHFKFTGICYLIRAED